MMKNVQDCLTESVFVTKSDILVSLVKPLFLKFFFFFLLFFLSVLSSSLTRDEMVWLVYLENVRVRRAGFCHREEFSKFLKRYKMLSSATWPKAPKGGLQLLIIIIIIVIVIFI